MSVSKSRDASGRLFVSVNSISSLKYRYVRWNLCRVFGLKKSSGYVKGLNEKCQIFSGEAGKLSIDWDTWSGFIVTSLSNEGDNLVEKIGCWLEERYG